MTLPEVGYLALRLILVIACACAALLFLGAATCSMVSDALLASLALVVGCRFLLGYRKEREAAGAADAGDQDRLKVDARTYYALNAFQSPHLLYVGLFGFVLKIVAFLASMPPLCSRVPGCW